MGEDNGEINKIKIDNAAFKQSLKTLDSQIATLSQKIEQIPQAVADQLEKTIDYKITAESQKLELKLKTIEMKYLKAALSFTVAIILNVVATVCGFIFK